MARPKYNVLMYHTDSPKERPTEVGALWELKDGAPGFMLSLKRGLAVQNLQGTRIVCLPNDYADGDQAESSSKRGGRRDD
jgi:hypothetical protein